MPEGPEIWRISDRLGDALSGREVREIFFAFDHLKEYEQRLTGRKITVVEPRGKAILTRFENELNIYSHNQLYGKWMISENGEMPDTNRKLRLAIHNQSASARLFSASEIEVLDDREMEEHDYLQKLGPDLLHPDVAFENVFRRYDSDEFRNRKLSTLLLDQGFLGGIGNYLRSEIMFLSGIHPDRKLRECTHEEREALAQNSLELARRSYETGGITTEPKIVEALKREGSSRRNYRHYVYGRPDKRCHKCGTVIEVKKTGGRKVFFCPECQVE